MYLHCVRKPIPCCYAVCTFLRIILSVFLEYDAAGGYFLSVFDALLHHESTDEYQLSDRQLVRIGIMCLYTIYICFV